MSIQAVQIVPAEERYAPAEHLVEFAVVDDDGGPLLLLSYNQYHEDGKKQEHSKIYDFPPLRVSDVCRALATFGVGVMGVFDAQSAARFQPAPPATEKDAPVA